MTRYAGKRGAGEVPGEGVRLRPALHFAPARNWMNDPNGLIQWNGRFHLFYQHNPHGLVLEQMAWGHASSTDLWNWADHPLALTPSADGPDQDGCWSGCAVVDHGTPHLLYTALRGKTTLPCLAIAADEDLIGWSRSERNPVIASWPPEPGVTGFRDHTAWQSGHSWYQVIGGGLADRGGALFLYRAENLLNWQYLGVMTAAADFGLPGRIWECPDVFTLGDTTVVIVSVWDDGPVRTMWMTGTIIGNTFVPEASGRCDGADRYYAAQSLSLDDGRRIAIGWLRESLGELAGQDRTRVGVMSLPRELYLENGALRSRPARELDGARGEVLASQVIEDAGSVGVTISARAGSATEISLTLAAGDAGLAVVRLRGDVAADVEIRVGAGVITIHEGGLLLTTELAAAADPATASASASASAFASGAIRIYYDSGILEVYSPSASPAAVICDRYASYDSMDFDFQPLPGSPSASARVTVWSTG
jgi:beta-fructofuranosidase